jgi:hypothetical protein
VNSAAEQTSVSIDLHVRNQSQQALRLALEIYTEVYGYDSMPLRYAGGAFALPPDGIQHLELDLQTPALRMNGMPIELTSATLADGNYFAALWVYQGEQIRRQIPVATFTRLGGQVSEVQPLSVNAVVTALNMPAQRLAVMAGDAIQLSGYELSASSLQRGKPLRVSLLWEALILQL